MTVYLDRRFRRVGRIKRAAGTAHKPTIRRLNEMMDGLFNSGRLDVLRAIQRGTYTLLQVFEFYRINEMEKLPTAATMGQLEETWKVWVENKECSQKHKVSLLLSLKNLLAGSKTAAVSDLPELLATLRVKMKKDAHAPTFRLAKAAAQAFVKSKLTKAHPMYFQVMAVEGLRVVSKMKKTPLLPDELMPLLDKMPVKYRDMARAMALTGMGPGEYWGDWVAGAAFVAIHGTKREGRERVVPTIESPSPARTEYRAFRNKLREVCDLAPYDLRRSYANLLEEAGIPRTRRKMYLGHGARDVTDLYERKEIARFIEQDRKRLQRYVVNATEKPTLRLLKKA